MSSPPTGILFYDARAKPLSVVGAIQPGAYYQFYLTGTVTPTNVYSDGGLTTPVSQTPGSGGTTAASDGRLIPLYMNPAITYRVQLYSSLGVLLEDTDPYVVPSGFFQLTQSQVGKALWPQTNAETNASVTPVNYNYPPGNALRYGINTTPGTTDMTAALNASLAQSYQPDGEHPYWPQSTYAVSKIAITSPVRIFSAGYSTILRQIAGTGSFPILAVQASQVDIDPLYFIGNIGTDTLEFNHAISVGGTSPISNITLRGAYGYYIRGDVVNIAGTATNPVTRVRVGPVDGFNIYRNACSVTGGEGIVIDSVAGTQVGYRNFDMEPNSISQFSTGVKVNTIYGSNCQFAGGNLAGGQGSIRIDTLDLDNSRLLNSNPSYPSFPGATNIGAICGDTQQISIGTYRARNFNERLVNFGNTIPSVSMVIENADWATNTPPGPFKCLVNTDAATSLEIKSGTIALTALDQYITKGSANIVRLRNLNVSGGGICGFTTNGEFENLAINCSGLAVVGVFFSLFNSFLHNIVFSNAASATLFTNATGNILMNTNGTFSAIEGTGCSDNMAMHGSVLNGIEYGVPTLISGSVASIAMADANQTLTATQALALSITCTGADTAARNLVVPSTPRVYTVFNNTSGGFGIQVIAASGTGTTIASTKRAMVQFDGTNVVRITPDT